MNDKTYKSFSEAETRRDELISQTGDQYKITQNEEGEYLCILTEHERGREGVDDEVIELHPSNKIILGYIIPLAIGLTVYVKSEDLTVAVVRLLNNSGILELVPKINGGFEFVGAALFTITFLKYLYKIYSKTYFIDSEAVRLVDGIWAKDAKIIKHKDIQTPTLKRSYTDRIFNTGTLLFSSSGTGSIDMIFEKIDDPESVLEHILRKT